MGGPRRRFIPSTFARAHDFVFNPEDAGAAAAADAATNASHNLVPPLRFCRTGCATKATSRAEKSGPESCPKGAIHMLLLTNCAVCAIELGLSSGKKCGRCATRYCGPECQKQHWEGGGHDKLCKKIKKEGGAEQYNANKKYAEAVEVAAAECAQDTKGQTCYICTQALHWKTKEGLVRMCACRGTAGFVHVSCLAEQAKILAAEAEENNLYLKVKNARWDRWSQCSLCEQGYHGAVAGALGWACWKTYLGRPETDQILGMAMTELGNGLLKAEHYEDALSVQEAMISMDRRRGAPEQDILSAHSNLSMTYQMLGRHEQALRVQRAAYLGYLKLFGQENNNTLTTGYNCAMLLEDQEEYKEVTVPQNDACGATRSRR